MFYLSKSFNINLRYGNFMNMLCCLGMVFLASISMNTQESTCQNFQPIGTTSTGTCVHSTKTCSPYSGMVQLLNNNCESAIRLTPEAEVICLNTVSGTTLHTSNSGVTDPACLAKGLVGGDVWYTFEATSLTHTISFSNVTTARIDAATIASAVYSGTCGALVEVPGSCGSGNTYRLVGGLTPGNTYYLRVWTLSIARWQASKFDICLGTPPPPPSNNLCFEATMLSVNTSDECIEVTPGTTFSSSNSGEATPSCGFTSLPGGDVWYQFIATNTTHYIIISDIVNVLGATADIVTAVYSGGCGALAQVDGTCASPGSIMRMVTGLNPGNKYYVRVWTSNANANQANSFNICIGTPPPPPSNDACVAATVLSVYFSDECTEVTSGTSLCSTNSLEAAPGCEERGLKGGDVWYQFTATNTTHYIIISNIVNVLGATSQIVTAVYSGGCGELALVSGTCASAGAGTRGVSGLSPGNNYYVRVWTSSTHAIQANHFSICIGTPPPPMSNNNCYSPAVLAVFATEQCLEVTAGNTLGSTNSEERAPTCSGTGLAGGDVWYQFTATNTTHYIIISDVVNVLGLPANIVTAVYSGGCGELTQVSGTCASTVAAIRVASGLSPGNNYYVRVWTINTHAFQASSFSICIGTPPPPPPNDECYASTVLIVNSSFVCLEATSGTTLSASNSKEAAPSCRVTGLNGGDVWYQFTATNTTHYVIISDIVNVLGASSQIVTAVYSGGCGDLTQISGSCKSTANFTNVVSGLSPGNNYYVRVWTSRSNVNQAYSFNICIGTEPPPPFNDHCSSPIVLSVNTTDECLAVTAGATVKSTKSEEEAPTCNTIGLIGGDVWYQFTAISTAHKIVLSDVVNVLGSYSAISTAVYSGNCGTLKQLFCSSAGLERLVLGLIPNETYYIRVWTLGTLKTQANSFNICIITPAI